MHAVLPCYAACLQIWRADEGFDDVKRQQQVLEQLPTLPSSVCYLIKGMYRNPTISSWLGKEAVSVKFRRDSNIGPAHTHHQRSTVLTRAAKVQLSTNPGSCYNTVSMSEVGYFGPTFGVSSTSLIYKVRSSSDINILENTRNEPSNATDRLTTQSCVHEKDFPSRDIVTCNNSSIFAYLSE